jgi:hypothetical protein
MVPHAGVLVHAHVKRHYKATPKTTDNPPDILPWQKKQKKSCETEKLHIYLQPISFIKTKTDDA